MFRIATYNIHKCRGLDRRIDPGRIAAVLRETAADVIALQEVWSIEDVRRPELHQARFIAEQLGYTYCIGENRRIKGRAYGNVTLSRWNVRSARNYDLTWHRREARGCLRADIETPSGGAVHVFNVHLGTAFLERRHQARRLISSEVLGDPAFAANPRVILGDFNEWTRGLASRLLDAHFTSVDIRLHLRRARTYPGVLPLLHLDHIYFDPRLRLERLSLHRSRAALIASDHLPLVADFQFCDTQKAASAS